MLTSPITDEHPPDEWQQNIPERAGWWDMRCDQNGQQSERVEITGRSGALFVECRHAGFRPLLRAHSGLTNVSWLDPLIQGRTHEVGAPVRHVRYGDLGRGVVVEVVTEGRGGVNGYTVEWSFGAVLRPYLFAELTPDIILTRNPPPQRSCVGGR